MSKVNEIREQIAAEKLLAEPISRKEVLERPISWDAYVTAGYITKDDLELVKTFAGRDLNAQYDLIDSGKKYIQVFIKLLRSVNVNETVQYIAGMLAEILEGDVARKTQYFNAIAVESHLFETFFSHLNKTVPDWYVCKELSFIATKLLCSKQCTATEEEKDKYIGWAYQELKNESLLNIRLGVKSLQKLLLVPHYREIFLGPKYKGLAQLNEVAKANIHQTKFQILYEACFCIWLALYDKETAASSQSDLIVTLVKAIRVVQKEKVRRVCLAALRNLLVNAENRQKMVACQLHRLVETLRQSKWGDAEIDADLAAINDQLAQEVLEMSSWDMYRSEIMTSVLLWSPVHISEKFWRENVTHFEDNDWEVLAKLSEIVRSSKDPLALAIAAHDFGEFVIFHPRGKAVLQQINIKVDLMKLLVHTDPDVRKNALFALQKIMANKVEYNGL